MSIFKKSKVQDEIINNQILKLQDINEKIDEFSNSNIDTSKIFKTKENFINKINDFYREDRKLNIGIIGQIKAGKSSFLNSLLFDGKDVLPKAVTPKTAVLTKLEYSENNELEIEFYTKDEWKQLEINAKLDVNTSEVQVAKEIITMIKRNNIQVDKYLGNKNYKIEFESYEKLKDELNDYVGENGQYTPLVKSVTLRMNNEFLKEISIIDTPGLNDPVISRTDKTKQFIEICDVVFFLSKSNRFLDEGDVKLLSAQLPKKGVKELILVCSQFDSVLLDIIDDVEDLSSAKVITKSKLKKEANKVFGRIVDDFKKRGYEESYIKVIESCKEPIFISSMAYNMSKKEVKDFTEQERIVFDSLNIDGDVTSEILYEIGNFTNIIEKYQNVIKNKEETLLKKSKNFVPNLKNEVNIELNNLKDIINQRINILYNEDKSKIVNKKNKINSQINSISSSIESVFGNIFINLEKNKIECRSDLRNAINEFSHISEKIGTMTKEGSYNVSTSKWYNPFSWGSYTTEYYTYEERYTYIDVSDAVENIRNFANESCNNIENTFTKSTQIQLIKKKLLNIIIEEFDTSDENYDSMYFKLLVERALNNIQFPTIKIDISDFVKNISNKFSGEITENTEKQNLKLEVAQVIAEMFENLSSNFEKTIDDYKVNLRSIQDKFKEALLEDINKEFQIVLEQFENKEKEIEKNKELLTIIEDMTI